MPKKGGKAAKKAEEAARKAEEERLAAIVEAERLERERLEMQEEERRLAEEKRMWLEAETKRLEEEKMGLEDFLTERSRLLLLEEKKKLEAEEWTSFMNCTHLPDVRKEADLSSYVVLWEEDVEPDLHRCLAQAQEAINVTTALEGLVAQAQAVKDEELTTKYRDYISRLDKLIVDKIDFATAHTLEHLDKHTTKDNTCQLSMNNALLRFGLWVNIAKNLRLKSIEYPELGLTTDIPRPIILQTVAVRMIHYRRDPYSPFELGDYFTIGGVLVIEVLEVPERPRVVKAHVPDVKDAGTWNMIRITETSGTVVRQPYPVVDPVTRIVQSAPPMQVNYTIPADVMLPEGSMPRVGRWNPELEGGKGGWDEDGINNDDIQISSNEDGTKVITFQTMHLTAVAVLQSRWACFPYKSWILQPMAPNRAMLLVQTNGINVKFEIGVGVARLLEPTLPGLAALRNNWNPPMQLLQLLRHHGVNLIPCDDDAAKISKDVGVDMKACIKQRSLEDSVCLGLSMLTPAFAISNSRVNPGLNPNEVVARVATCIDYQSAPLKPDSEGWRSLLFRDHELQYCTMLEATAETATHGSEGQILDDEGVNYAPPTVGVETKAFPLSVIREKADGSTVTRCADSSPSFTEAVRVMMDTMRLFSFVGPEKALDEDLFATNVPAEGAEAGGKGASGEAAQEAAESKEGEAPKEAAAPEAKAEEKPGTAESKESKEGKETKEEAKEEAKEN